MTTVELERIARDIVPPVGASMAIATLDHTPGAKPGTGRTDWRVGFLVDGRGRVPVGPVFERQRDALRLVDLLNGTTPPT